MKPAQFFENVRAHLPWHVGALGIIALASMVLQAAISRAAPGVDPRVAPGGISLKQALEKGLKARRPSEFKFIALVIKKVEQGKLPVKMVERTFLWARRQQQEFPMPYFEKAMQIQAKKLGVDLPFTDT